MMLHFFILLFFPLAISSPISSLSDKCDVQTDHDYIVNGHCPEVFYLDEIDGSKYYIQRKGKFNEPYLLKHTPGRHDEMYKLPSHHCSIDYMNKAKLYSKEWILLENRDEENQKYLMRMKMSSVMELHDRADHICYQIDGVFFGRNDVIIYSINDGKAVSGVKLTPQVIEEHLVFTPIINVTDPLSSIEILQEKHLIQIKAGKQEIFLNINEEKQQLLTEEPESYWKMATIGLLVILALLGIIVIILAFRICKRCRWNISNNNRKINGPNDGTSEETVLFNGLGDGCVHLRTKNRNHQQTNEQAQNHQGQDPSLTSNFPSTGGTTTAMNSNVQTQSLGSRSVNDLHRAVQQTNNPTSSANDGSRSHGNSEIQNNPGQVIAKNYSTPNIKLDEPYQSDANGSVVDPEQGQIPEIRGNEAVPHQFTFVQDLSQRYELDQPTINIVDDIPEPPGDDHVIDIKKDMQEDPRARLLDVNQGMETNHTPKCDTSGKLQNNRNQRNQYQMNDNEALSEMITSIVNDRRAENSSDPKNFQNIPIEKEEKVHIPDILGKTNSEE